MASEPSELFQIEPYLEEKAISRTLELYKAVIFNCLMYAIPAFGVLITIMYGVAAHWTPTLTLASAGFVAGVLISSMLAYTSHVSKRYLGLVCFSSLYALRSGKTLFIEWIPIRVRSIPIPIGGQTVYLNEVICHPDSDVPYLLLVTPSEFDTAGGRMCKTSPDVKFHRGVRCPVALGYNVLVDYRAVDIGVFPGEDMGITQVEEKIPVPLVWMFSADWHYEQFWKKTGLYYPGPEIVPKVIHAEDALYARYYKEKCDLLLAQLAQEERTKRDFHSAVADAVKKLYGEKMVFETSPELKRTLWSTLTPKKKIGVLALICLAILAGIILIMVMA